MYYRETSSLFQIRKYFAGQLWAVSNVVENDWNSAINKGFRNVFKYISGLNAEHQVVSMAVPGSSSFFRSLSRISVTALRFTVLAARSLEGVDVAFFIPSNFSKPPTPSVLSEVEQIMQTLENCSECCRGRFK